VSSRQSGGTDGGIAAATAELQTILDASPVGIALFGRDQAIQRCNPAFERIIGWKATSHTVRFPA